MHYYIITTLLQSGAYFAGFHNFKGPCEGKYIVFKWQLG